MMEVIFFFILHGSLYHLYDHFFPPIRFYTPMHPYYFQRAEGRQWLEERECQLHRRHISTAGSYGNVLRPSNP